VAQNCRAGNECVVVVAVFSNVRSGRCGGTGDPVAGHPFAAGGGGME
jgi:hypothetical protein